MTIGAEVFLPLICFVIVTSAEDVGSLFGKAQQMFLKTLLPSRFSCCLTVFYSSVLVLEVNVAAVLLSSKGLKLVRICLISGGLYLLDSSCRGVSSGTLQSSSSDIGLVRGDLV